MQKIDTADVVSSASEIFLGKWRPEVDHGDNQPYAAAAYVHDSSVGRRQVGTVEGIGLSRGEVVMAAAIEKSLLSDMLFRLIAERNPEPVLLQIARVGEEKPVLTYTLQAFLTPHDIDKFSRAAELAGR